MTDPSPALRGRLPWWLHVLWIFLASRVVTTAMLLCFAHDQAKNAWTGARPGYLAYSQLWDSHWYLIVAFSGYPSMLPMTDDGHVDQNAWAFYPLYPWLSRLLSFLLPVHSAADPYLAYEAMAVVVSVVAALGAALLTYRLFAEAGLSRAQALGGVALFLAAPTSAILQVGYSEPLGLLLLAWALLELQRRRYWLTIVPAVLMAFTRPSGLAFALAVGIHVVVRWVHAARASRSGGRLGEPFPFREQLAAIVAALGSAVAGVAWLLIAAAATGSATAYTDTELFWRASYIGYGKLVPFGGWFAGAAWWAERIDLPAWTGIAGAVVVMAAFAAFLFTPWARRLGPTIRIWAASWFVYLLAVFFPQSSTWRMMLPTYPLVGAFALRRWMLWVTLAAFLVGQWFWIDQEWAVAGYDWTPP